ncbi:MAG TPA: sigma-70 family RNA polymerase sigma factor [Ignavibacteriaceae bacterium]|nr:sigma-70 family RNA polymerase sigma factor [Ignavibacteriaceae bacterium]
MVTNSTDAELIDRFISTGDMKILGELFLRYSHLVFGVCYKYLHNTDDSKDAVVDIFNNLSGLLKVHQVRNFKPWLYSVAKNHCLMQLRKKSVENLSVPLPENEENETDFMEFPDFIHLIDESEEEVRISLLYKSVDELEEGQKICIRMFFLENKSYKEIFDNTGYDFKQVKSYIQNGKRNLRLKLEKLKVNSE